MAKGASPNKTIFHFIFTSQELDVLFSVENESWTCMTKYLFILPNGAMEHIYEAIGLIRIFMKT